LGRQATKVTFVHVPNSNADPVPNLNPDTYLHIYRQTRSRALWSSHSNSPTGSRHNIWCFNSTWTLVETPDMQGGPHSVTTGYYTTRLDQQLANFYIGPLHAALGFTILLGPLAQVKHSRWGCTESCSGKWL